MANSIQYYCAGFFWYGSDPENQLPRFIKGNLWENGFDDKYIQKVKSVPVGSRIAAKTSYTRKVNGKTISVLEVHAIGEVTENPGNGKTLKVKWDSKFKPFTIDGRGAYRSTISQVHHKENIDLIFGNKTKPQDAALVFDETDRQLKHPLNQILAGPPGTGKTYNTINRAVAIIDRLKPDSLSKYYDGREDIKDRFEELKALGQIGFCTFHQSMNYEDFIEGIKPVMADEDSDEDLDYIIEDGIFKQMCVRAKYDFYRHGTPDLSANINRAEFFNIAYDELISNLEDKIGRGEEVVLKTKTDLKLHVVEISNKLNLKIKHTDAEREKPYIVSKKRLLKLFLHFSSITDIHNLHKDIRGVIGGANTTAYWAVLSILYKTYEATAQKQASKKEASTKSRDYETIKSIVNSFKITSEELSKTEPERYVLIIDEINRGNVSQIFGELITLIEEDKRLGNPEVLEVLLPYNKDELFGVPPNLYIIGTMNTADRSVEALDTALRRRFAFEEMPPKYDLEELGYEYAGFKVSEILMTINRRIEKLLDKDHLIGHSFLIKKAEESPVEKLKETFYRNIIPLLQEYFFGDYGKIGLVLGAGFVELKSWDKNKNGFAKFEHEADDDFADKRVYQIIDYSKTASVKNTKDDDPNFEKAIRLLMT